MKIFLYIFLPLLAGMTISFLVQPQEFGWGPYSLGTLLSALVAGVVWAISKPQKTKIRLAVLLIATGVTVNTYVFVFLFLPDLDYRRLGFIAVMGTIMVLGGCLMALRALSIPLTSIRSILN